MTENCEGNLVLYEGTNEIHVTGDEDFAKSVMVDKVKMEGCGCFEIYSKMIGRSGWRLLVEKEGDTEVMRKIRTIRRRNCF